MSAAQEPSEAQTDGLRAGTGGAKHLPLLPKASMDAFAPTSCCFKLPDELGVDAREGRRQDLAESDRAHNARLLGAGCGGGDRAYFVDEVGVFSLLKQRGASAAVEISTLPRSAGEALEIRLEFEAAGHAPMLHKGLAGQLTSWNTDNPHREIQ